MENVTRFKRLAEYDSLTDIYNRRYYMKVTEKMIRDMPEVKFAFITGDIDQFRLFNNSFGKKAGDELLKRIANQLSEDLKTIPVKTYGYIGADVFSMCLPYHKEPLENALLKTKNIIQNYFISYKLKASFGIYIIENNGIDVEKAYTYAKTAAKKCKHNYEKVFAYYDQDMFEQEQKEQHYSNSMERGIKEKQFKVYLQPKYSTENDRPCGAEALVRWNHPEWGMVNPGEFIPVFERNGMIVELDYYMWENVCMILKRWRDENITFLPVSVNVSRVSMYNPKIVEKIVELTDKYGIPRQQFNLEITESAYMSNPDLMKSIINNLRELGFVILMDDFGSGYSSLNTLKDIDVDMLKIDMKFLPSGHENVKSEKILASISRMAGWIGTPVIIEGVETREQKEFLESIGCRYIQGFYYAKPMPVKDFEDLIRNMEKDEKSGHMVNAIKKARDDSQALDSVWSSDEETNILFTSVSVPVAIFEYAEGEIDILRMNNAYIHAFHGKKLERYMFVDDRIQMKKAVERSISSHENEIYECIAIMPDGQNRWYQIRINFISTIGKASLLGVTFCDITIQKNLETDLNKIINVLHDKNTKRDGALVIDDDKVSRSILCKLLKDNYEIYEAPNGREGIDVLNENIDNISVILLDMIMPVMDGKNFLLHKNAIAKAADIPVVVISSDVDKNTQKDMIKNGVNDYITKPYIPETVLRRLKNVMEYNSKFREHVKEYKNVDAFNDDITSKLNLTGYGMKTIHQLMGFMSKIFDVVRLVDPRDTSVITIDDMGNVSRQPYSCFRVWGKEERCINCSSMCAINGQCSINKFELILQDVFYVVSQPVKVYLDKETAEELVLEVVSHIIDETPIKNENVKTVYKLVEEINVKLYADPLTGANNRRYFDDMLFLHRGQNSIAREVGFILMDLFCFKQINDMFGHHIGDKILKETTNVIYNQIRKEDSLIRYGGDEFIVVVTNCEEEHIRTTIKRLSRAIETIKYGPGDTISAEADFGYSYTKNFVRDNENLKNMIQEADKSMYVNKQAHHKRIDELRNKNN